MFHGAGECEIGLPRRSGRSYWGESQILLHLFVTHTILPIVDFKGFMAQKDRKSKLKQAIIHYFNDFLMMI